MVMLVHLPRWLPGQGSYSQNAPRNAPLWVSVRVSPRKASRGWVSYHPSHFQRHQRTQHPSHPQVRKGPNLGPNDGTTYAGVAGDPSQDLGEVGDIATGELRALQSTPLARLSRSSFRLSRRSPMVRWRGFTHRRLWQRCLTTWSRLVASRF